MLVLNVKAALPGAISSKRSGNKIFSADSESSKRPAGSWASKRLSLESERPSCPSGESPAQECNPSEKRSASAAEKKLAFFAKNNIRTFYTFERLLSTRVFQQIAFFKAKIFRAAYDYVVQDAHAKNVRGVAKAPCRLNVLVAWTSAARRMVVGQDDRSPDFERPQKKLRGD